MLTPIVELAAVVLFIGCAWHANRFEGRSWAEQWFIAGYLFALIREDVLQVAFPIWFYAPTILRLGAAPALVSLLYCSIPYLGYVFARRIMPAGAFAPTAALVFLAASSFAIPLEATAAAARWWLYEDPGFVVFGNMPLAAPFLWGGAAVLFYSAFRRVQTTRLPGRGKLYAMIVLAPVIAILHVIYTLLLTVIL